MEKKKFTPVPGEVYRNHGRGKYHCLRSGGIFEPHTALMQNVSSRWTFVAWSCDIYSDGTIEWAGSTHGTFAHTQEDVKAFIFDRYAEALCGIGPALKERILQQADNDPDISAIDLRRLAAIASLDDF